MIWKFHEGIAAKVVPKASVNFELKLDPKTLVPATKRLLFQCLKLGCPVADIDVSALRVQPLASKSSTETR